MLRHGMVAAVRRAAAGLAGCACSRGLVVTSTSSQRALWAGWEAPAIIAGSSRCVRRPAQLPAAAGAPRRRCDAPLSTTLWTRLSREVQGEDALPQLPSGFTYFDVYGLRVGFAVDVKLLDERWKLLQSVLHPDKFALSCDERKAQAAELSRVINQARIELRSPLARAKYILKLHGFDLADDQVSLQASQSFLLEMMEAREDVEDAASEAELELLKEKTLAVIEDCEGELAQRFAADDIDGALQGTVRLIYMTRLLESIEEKLY